MNKKELYRKLVEEITIIDINRFNYSDSFRAGEAAGKIKGLESAKKLLNQLDEPELPAIPQFVASAIEKTKENRKNITILNIFNEVTVSGFYTELVDDWILKNPDLFTIAWFSKEGYTIEPPKTRQVLVKFFDNEEYKTELTEESAKELIEFLEANKK